MPVQITSILEIKPVRPAFYEQSTIDLAKKLLGSFIVHQSKQGGIVGRIVETEAYLSDEPASHAFHGPTPRNRVMFGAPGRAYIYFIYGKHYCLNVVSGPEGKGEAVLIRALEPIAGIDLMKKNRPGAKDVVSLCNGPAKLVEAFGITKDLNGCDFSKGPLFLFKKKEEMSHPIVTTTRIGIRFAAELPLRFYIRKNRFVSRW